VIFPWNQMEDGRVWFRHNDNGQNVTQFHPPSQPNVSVEEVTLIPTFGLHYMRAMREANLVRGTNRLGQYGQRLNPKGLRFWLESKYYGQSVARFKWRQRNKLSSVSPDVKQSMGLSEYPS
jgi:hypothetical protein